MQVFRGVEQRLSAMGLVGRLRGGGEASVSIELLEPSVDRFGIERGRNSEQSEGALTDDLDVSASKVRLAPRLPDQRGALVNECGLSECDCALPLMHRSEAHQSLPCGKQHGDENRQRDGKKWRVERKLERALRAPQSIGGHIEEDRSGARAVEKIEQRQRRS